MFFCIMTRGRIRTPTTPKIEFPMTISNCFLSINIITKRSIPDVAETLNSLLVIAIQNSPTIILLDSGQHPEKFSRSFVCIIGRGCEVSCILIFAVPFDMEYEIFYPCISKITRSFNILRF